MIQRRSFLAAILATSTAPGFIPRSSLDGLIVPKRLGSPIVYVDIVGFKEVDGVFRPARLGSTDYVVRRDGIGMYTVTINDPKFRVHSAYAEAGVRLEGVTQLVK